MSAMIDLADGQPYRYRHGWIKITDSAAANQNGKDVAGHLGEGKGVVVGKYNHNLGTVTDAKGARHKVVAVNGERNEAGFKGQVATSHLPDDIKGAIMGYDANVKAGNRTEAAGLRRSRKKAAPTGVRTPPPGYAQSFGRYIGAANQPGRTFDMSQPKLGSGARFKKLSGTLAARGAKNPDALAAYIGRKKYGAKRFGGLSHHNMANGGLFSILLADTGYDNSEMRCPSCGYEADSARFAISGGASGTSAASSGSLRTPSDGDVSGTGFNAQSVTVRAGNPSGALSNTGQRDVRLAGEQLHPGLKVSGPYDFMINRSDEDPSVAIVRHRRGGSVIGEIEHLEDGSWAGKLGGRRLDPHTQQRAALMELLGVHNRSVASASQPGWQAPRTQTPLMRQYGIPAVSGFATPTNGASDGPRTTTSGSSDSDSSGSGGLTPKGMAIYKKLKTKGFPDARAMAFAKRAQSFGGGGSSKAA